MHSNLPGHFFHEMCIVLGAEGPRQVQVALNILSSKCSLFLKTSHFY